MNKLILLILALTTSAIAIAQTPLRNNTDARDSPAYQLLVTHKIKLALEINRLRKIYTPTHPTRIKKEDQFQALNHEIDRVRRIPPNLDNRLSETYGKLLLCKVKVEAELKVLRGDNKAQHPKVINKEEELVTLRRELERMLR